MNYRPITTRDTTINIVILAFFLFFAAVLAWLTVDQRISAPILLAYLLAAVFFLTKWNISTRGYQCPFCQHQFDIGMGTALMTPHLWHKKFLRCPACAKTGWAQEIVKVKAG